MRTWRVYGLLTGTKFLGRYEAKSKEQAIDMALNSEKNYVSLCHQCSDDFDLDENLCQSAVAEIE